jgi:DNA-binding transcriptional ArsR family regulator
MDSHRAFKASLYEQFAVIGKALASPARLELLDLIGQSESSVEDLALEAGLSVANTSQHLQVLRQAGLVEVHREGKFSYYCLAGKEAFKTWQSIRDFAAVKVAKVQRPRRARGRQHRGVAPAAYNWWCRPHRRASGSGISRRSHSRRAIGAVRKACNHAARVAA